DRNNSYISFSQLTTQQWVRKGDRAEDAFLVVAAILFFVLCVYAFFYLNLSTEINLDVDMD
ncbi:hypothetical protein XENORESO_014279, partial [Xenotaenia resolanae]